MPVPIFEQPMKKVARETEPKSFFKEGVKVPPLVVFFAVVLFFLMVLTVELALIDVNRVLNPYYGDCRQDNGSVCQLGLYEESRLILHADLIVAVIVVVLAVIFIFWKSEKDAYLRILRLTLIFFSIWLFGRAIVEAEYFLIRHHALIGKYVLLFTGIALVMFLTYLFQKKFSNKKV